MHNMYGHNAVAVYECIDEFVKIFLEAAKKNLITTTNQRFRVGKLNLTEQLFIAIGFHLAPFKTWL